MREFNLNTVNSQYIKIETDRNSLGSKVSNKYQNQYNKVLTRNYQAVGGQGGRLVPMQSSIHKIEKTSDQKRNEGILILPSYDGGAIFQNSSTEKSNSINKFITQ